MSGIVIGVHRSGATFSFRGEGPGRGLDEEHGAH
jgi:hypothetical protein